MILQSLIAVADGYETDEITQNKSHVYCFVFFTYIFIFSGNFITNQLVIVTAGNAAAQRQTKNNVSYSLYHQLFVSESPVEIPDITRTKQADR